VSSGLNGCGAEIETADAAQKKKIEGSNRKKGSRWEK